MLQPSATGRRVTYTYKHRWIGPDAASRLPRARTILLAFANAPYREAIPVRLATLATPPAEDDVYVSLDLELGPLVEPDVGALTEALAELGGESRLGGRFVLPGSAGFEPRLAADVPAAWRAIVDRLRRHEDYAESCFLRLDGYEVAGRRVATADGPPTVPVGQEVALLVESRNDHLPDRDREQIRLIADAPGWTIALDEPLLAEGVMRLPLVPEPEDRPELQFSLGVRPRWADSSVLRISMPLSDAGEAPQVPGPSKAPETPAEPDLAELAPSPPGEPEPVISIAAPSHVDIRPQDGQRLLRALKRDGWRPTLSVLEDHLLRWFPGDVRLEEERLRLLFDAGRPEEAAARYAELAPEVRVGIDPWLRFRCCAQAGDHEGAIQAIEDIADFSTERLDELVAGLVRLPRDGTTAALSRLAEALLGEYTLAELLRRVARATSDPVLLGTIAAFLSDYAELHDEALNVLQRQLATGFDPDLANQALALAEEMPGRQHLGPWVVRLIESTLEQGGFAAAQPLIEAVWRDLRPDQAMDLVPVLVRYLDALDPIADHLQRLARELLAEGRLDDAASLAALLGAEQGDMAALLVEELERHLGTLDSVRKMLAADRQERIRRAAERADGMHLILVGGEEIDGLADELVSTFRFGKVEWICGEYGRVPSVAKVEQARPESHVVVIITDHSGHDLTGNAEEACRKAGVTPVRCGQWGKSSIERTVLDALAPPGGGA